MNYHVQLWQVKSGTITWACTNSPTAPNAYVTAIAVRARQLAK